MKSVDEEWNRCLKAMQYNTSRIRCHKPHEKHPVITVFSDLELRFLVVGKAITAERTEYVSYGPSI